MGFKVVLITLLLLTFQTSDLEGLETEKCEVCVNVLNKLLKILPNKEMNDTKSIEERFMEFCKKTHGKENRFCYYLGGLSDSATGVLSEMSKPLSYGLPIEKICERLGAKDGQICDMRYKKAVDVESEEDLLRMKVVELKSYLSDFKEDCKGCVRKKDYIDKILSLKSSSFEKDEL